MSFAPLSLLASFAADESGHAVIDWAAITLATIVTGNLMFEDVADRTMELAQMLEQQLFSIEIKTTF